MSSLTVVERENILNTIISLENSPILNDDLSGALQEQRRLHLFIQNGLTKVALLSEKFPNWVIKFSRENPEQEDIDDYEDYCAKEYGNYLIAKTKGLEEYFAEIQFFGTFFNKDFYIQRRAEVDEDKVSDEIYSLLEEENPKEEEEDIDDYYDSISQLEDELSDEDRLAYLFGTNDKLVDFIERYSINDLHVGNFGYINKKPVIIDYSGF